LIGGFAKSATSLIRQLVDAGTLSNLPGGLKSRGLRIKGGDTPIAPGEFRDVDVGSGSIRDNILPLPYKAPSTVLYQLLGNIVEEGRRFAATADMKVSDMSAQAPVGTTLAILERQLKVLSAVQARTHYSLKQELKLLKGLIRDYTPDEYTYDPEYGTKRAKQSDYDAVDVIPVSDPNAATLSQRVVQYQAVIQMAQMAPQIYDLPQLHRSMLDVLGIKNAEKLVPLPDDEKPTDPVTENQQLLRGKPLKAFFYQDHAAHIAVHNMMIQDPMIAAQLGQNPMAQQMLASLQAHIAEHVGFQMRQQIEARMGTPLPPEDEKLPPQIELALSGMMAKAAQQMVAMDQAKMAQMQAMQQAQDPVVQMQQQELALRQQELQLKAQEIQIKAQKAAADTMVDQAKVQLETKKALANMQLEAIKTGTQVQQSRQKAASEAEKLRAQAQSDDKKLAAQARQQLMNSLSRAQTPPKGDSNK